MTPSQALADIAGYLGENRRRSSEFSGPATEASPHQAMPPVPPSASPAGRRRGEGHVTGFLVGQWRFWRWYKDGYAGSILGGVTRTSF